MKFFAALAGILAWPFAVAAPAQAEEASICVRVLDGQRQPVRGLSRADFTLRVNGHEPDILRSVEIGASPDAANQEDALHLVLYIDPEMHFRERFRSRRAALALIEAIDPRREAVAVQSRNALSGFTQDRRRMRRLLLFFGDLGDRYGFGMPYSGSRQWKRRWPSSVQRSGAATAVATDFAGEVDELYFNGSAGDLASNLTRFKGLPGRKALFYFGRDVPYGDQRLERHDPSFAARVLSDAGFAVAAFNPSGARDRGTRRLALWAEGTGGFVQSHWGDLRQAVKSALQRLRHSYRLTYRRPVARHCGFREVSVAAACQGCRTLYPSGDFATVEAPLSWEDRTLLTTALQEDGFRDFQVELTASLGDSLSDGDGPSQPRRVEVSAAFLFAAAGDEETMVRMANSGRFRQRALFLMGVYDEADRLLGSFQGTAYFEMEPREAVEALARKARLDRSIELTMPGSPATVRAIVVTGSNRRISTATVRLPGN